MRRNYAIRSIPDEQGNLPCVPRYTQGFSTAPVTNLIRLHDVNSSRKVYLSNSNQTWERRDHRVRACHDRGRGHIVAITSAYTRCRS